VSRRVEQAGAIVYRRKDDDTVRILLVSSRRTTGRWIFPKGHIDAGEAAEMAALREAREEAGILGRIIQPIEPALEYRYGGDAYRVRYFLVEWTGDGLSDEDRECRWLGPERALATVTDDDARDLLRHAIAAISRHSKRR